MNLSATIAKMRACGMTAEAIVDCLEELKPAAFAVFLKKALGAGLPPDEIGELVATIIDPELLVDDAAPVPPAGPKARWGYSGPVTPRLKDEEWLPLRWSILQRDGFYCSYCGVEGELNARWCVDHIIPLSRGGTNDPENLTACCFPCNSSKSDRLLSEWDGRNKMWVIAG
jgi:hypothetical protein